MVHADIMVIVILQVVINKNTYNKSWEKAEYINMQRIGFTVTDRIVNDVQGKFFFPEERKFMPEFTFHMLNLLF